MAEWINKKDITADGVEFQMAEMGSKERFKLWSVTDKKFYKDGDKVMTEKGEMTVGKFMKLSDNDKKHLNRNVTFSRRVIVNDTEKFIEMPKAAEEKLVELTSLMQEAGLDPLDYTFIVKRNGSGLETRDEVKKGDKIGKKGVAQSTIVEEANDLNGAETQIVDALKQSITERKLDIKAQQVRVAYLQALVDNGIERTRANEIMDKYF